MHIMHIDMICIYFFRISNSPLLPSPTSQTSAPVGVDFVDHPSDFGFGGPEESAEKSSTTRVVRWICIQQLNKKTVKQYRSKAQKNHWTLTKSGSMFSFLHVAVFWNVFPAKMWPIEFWNNFRFLRMKTHTHTTPCITTMNHHEPTVEPTMCQ